MDHLSLIADVEEFVRALFDAFKDKEYPYHNLQHTSEVAAHATDIGQHYQLSPFDCDVVVAAAWFHDVGHLFGDTEGHEQVGVLMMQNYFLKKDAAGDLVTAVADCIMATRTPTHPKTLNEMILCDADTFHFGTPYFRETDTAIRRELELRTGKKMPDWNQQSIRLLEEHRFYTDYCQQLLDEGKRINITWLRSKLQ